MPIINGQGRIGVRVQVPLLLDTYTGAAAAYSLRKLSNTYNGPAIRVRRSSNNAELNIGFNSDGTLDTTTLLSFVGAGDGFVVTIFDQSGNGLDLSWWQAVTQAKIVTNGVIESHNGKPTINTDGKGGYSFYKSSIGYWQTLTYKTMFMVGKTETVNTTSGDYNYLHEGERVWFNSYQNKYGTLVNTYQNPISGVAPTGWVSYQLDGASTNQTLFYLNMRSSKLYMSINGNSETMMGAFPSTLSTQWMFSFGPGYNFASRFNGKFSEIIFYNSDKSANKAAIESNMNSYYSIYSPTPSIVSSGLILNLDAGNAASYPGTGTVWSDLSGNGNHATLVNGVGYSSANGGYLTFDGSNDYAIKTSVSGVTSQTVLSLECWVNFNSTSGTQVITSHGKNIGGPTGGVPLLYINGGTLRFEFGSSRGLVNSNFSVSTSTWYHVVGTADGTNTKIYINGVLKNTSSQGDAAAATTPSFLVGGLSGPTGLNYGSLYFNGKCAKGALYMKCLSDAEVLQNYNALKTRYGL